jgi:hypothetical protein
MTLKKLIAIMKWIEAAYTPDEINLSGSLIWCSGGGELMITFNTQPPRDLDLFLRRRGFIVLQGEYIYRPRTRLCKDAASRD